MEEPMAQANHAYTTSKFHNLSNEALADAIGQADAVLKSAEAECNALKNEFKQAVCSQPPASNLPSPGQIRSPVGSTFLP
jgi:hypothetical protein